MSPSSVPRDLLTPSELHILLSLGEEARHGYAIQQAVEERTGGELKLRPGTLYEALHRMVEAGWIREVASSDARRKVYELTPAGRSELESELSRLEAIVRFARTRDLLPDPSAE